MFVWLNGRLLPAARARLSVFDHGFLYGDGLYETVRVSAGRVRFWPDHYRRLTRSARALALPCPWSASYLKRALERLARANRQRDVSLRLTLSRGEGPLGLDPSLCKHPALILQPHPQRPLKRWQREGVSAGVIPQRFRLNPEFKSLNQLDLVMAKLEARQRGFFEGLLLNPAGEVTEGLTSNLFFVRRGVLHTPALAAGLLPGVTRAVVLRLARRARISVREGRYRPRDLDRAQELFLTNASFGIVPVTRLDSSARSLPSSTFSIGPLTRRLQHLYGHDF